MTRLFGLPEFSYWNLFVFGSIISSSNVGFMVSFFKTTGITSKLVVFLEGESMFSEVISSLLYRSLVDLQINISSQSLVMDVACDFISVLLFSFIISLIIVSMGYAVFKYCLPSSDVFHYGKVILFLSIGIVSHLIAEGYHLPGGVCIRFSGFLLSYLAPSILSEESYPFS